MGLTYLNPLSINGKNGLHVNYRPGTFTLSVISITWLKGKEPGALQTRSQVKLQIPDWSSPASPEPCGQKDYKNWGLSLFFPFFLFYLLEREPNKTHRVFFPFYMNFALVVVGLRAPWNAVIRDPEKRFLARCLLRDSLMGEDALSPQ